MSGEREREIESGFGTLLGRRINGCKRWGGCYRGDLGIRLVILCGANIKCL